MSIPPPSTKWKVIWREQGKLRLKRFQDKLQDAIAFYREQKGLEKEVYLVCANKGFPPFKPGHKRYVERPSSKHMWCAYCMAWRQFRMTAIRTDGILGEPQLRCPICTISINDWYIQKYNGLLEHTDMEKLKKLVGAW